MSKARALRHSALVLFRGAILIAAVSAICYRAGLNSASTALVFLIAVVLHSLDCSFLESTLVSILAVASLDYYFMDPPFSLTVARPLDIMTLACLLTTSLVITRLQSNSREEAASSNLHRQYMTRLYHISQELLGQEPSLGVGPAMLRPMQEQFALKAISIFDAMTLEGCTAGRSEYGIEARTREAYIAGQDADVLELKIAVRCLWVRGTIAGAIGMEGLSDPELTAPSLAALAAAALERARAFCAAANAAAHADAEMLRSAVLDALAHEIKTPLATILTAAGGILATGEVQPEQAELAEMIETEASRLGELASRLLRVARLDNEEIKPRLERVSLAELAERSARRYAALWPDRRISFRAGEPAAEVRAEMNLILLAIGQLLENACRYSHADANVRIEVCSGAGTATITVINDGTPIPASEHVKIFERFYRGAGARQNSPGTGLGLYVAQKIAVAHDGCITLLDAGPDAVGFRLTLPAATREASFGAEEVQAADRG